MHSAPFATVHFRLETRPISRTGSIGVERSSAGTVAYRAGLVVADARTGEIHDYTRKRGVLRDCTEVLAPAGSPVWMFDPVQLAAKVELVEKRKDAQLYRELLVDLPEQLTLAQQRAALNEFLRTQVLSLGMAAIINIHEPHGPEADETPTGRRHAHVLLTMRRPKPDGSGFGNKERSWNDQGLTEKWRYAWADIENGALEAAGCKERCSPKRLRDQAADAGLDPDSIDVPLPQPKRGPGDWRGREDRQEAWRLWEEAEAARKEAVKVRDRRLELEAELAEAERDAAQAAQRDLAAIQERAAAAARARIEEDRAKAERQRDRETARKLRELRANPSPMPKAPAPRPQPVVAAITPADEKVRAAWLEDRIERRLPRYRLADREDLVDLARYWRDNQLPDGSWEYINRAGRVVDAGNEIRADAGNDVEIRAMLQLAIAKRWASITFTGDDRFKLQAMKAAIVAGIPVAPVSGEDSEILARARAELEPPAAPPAHPLAGLQSAFDRRPSPDAPSTDAPSTDAPAVGPKPPRPRGGD